MDIDVRSASGVTILDLSGRLTIGEGDVRLRGEVLDQLEDGRDKLLVNMQGVKVVDSAGLGELIRTKTTCARRGATIKLVNLNLKVYRLLTMAQLTGVFEIFDDEAKAVESFAE